MRGAAYPLAYALLVFSVAANAGVALRSRIQGTVYGFDSQSVTLISSNHHQAWRVPTSIINPAVQLKYGKVLMVEGLNSQIQSIPVPRD